MSNWQYPSIDLDNGLVPNRRQAIIWNNADQMHVRIYSALRGDKLHDTLWKYFGSTLKDVYFSEANHFKIF